MKGNINEFISRATDDSLVCRVDRHDYDPRKSTVDMDGGIYVWSRICGRCGVKRIQRLRRNGIIVSNTYVYPKDWIKSEGGSLGQIELGKVRIHIMTNGLA